MQLFRNDAVGTYISRPNRYLLRVDMAGTVVTAHCPNPGRLTEIWTWVRSLHIVWQGVIWLLFLPWMIALWIWTLPWAAPVRIALVVATLLWTNWLLCPWKA